MYINVLIEKNVFKRKFYWRTSKLALKLFEFCLIKYLIMLKGLGVRDRRRFILREFVHCAGNLDL